MKKIKIGLLPCIIIAIILGIAIGTIFPAPLVRIFIFILPVFLLFGLHRQSISLFLLYAATASFRSRIPGPS